MEDDKKNENGRRPKNSKWKTTNKIKMEDDQKKSKWKTTKKHSKWQTTKKKENIYKSVFQTSVE